MREPTLSECPKCGRGDRDWRSFFDPSRVDELSAEQARELHRALAFYGYCTPHVPESIDRGETR